MNLVHEEFVCEMDGRYGCLMDCCHMSFPKGKLRFPQEGDQTGNEVGWRYCYVCFIGVGRLVERPPGNMDISFQESRKSERVLSLNAFRCCWVWVLQRTKQQLLKAPIQALQKSLLEWCRCSTMIEIVCDRVAEIVTIL